MVMMVSNSGDCGNMVSALYFPLCSQAEGQSISFLGESIASQGSALCSVLYLHTSQSDVDRWQDHTHSQAATDLFETKCFQAPRVGQC